MHEIISSKSFFPNKTDMLFYHVQKTLKLFNTPLKFHSVIQRESEKNEKNIIYWTYRFLSCSIVTLIYK